MDNTQYPPHEVAIQFFSKRIPIGEYTWEYVEENDPFPPEMIDLLETPITLPPRLQPIGTKIWLKDTPHSVTINTIFSTNQEFEEYVAAVFKSSLETVAATFVYPTPELTQEQLIRKLYSKLSENGK